MGPTQCDTLGDQRTPTKNGDSKSTARSLCPILTSILASSRSFCYQMRVIQAFSWMITAIMIIAFLILLSLVSQAQRLGRLLIWQEDIRGLFQLLI